MCPFWITTSFFSPSVSGRRSIAPVLFQVMHAAVATEMAEAAPEVTIAAGTPSKLAIRAPTFSCSSGIGTNHCAASAIACTTSGGMIEPPSVVYVPWPLISGLMLSLE